MVEISQSGSGEGFGYSTKYVTTSGATSRRGQGAKKERRHSTRLMSNAGLAVRGPRGGHGIAGRGTQYRDARERGCRM
jgi:hypothetical protein